MTAATGRAKDRAAPGDRIQPSSTRWRTCLRERQRWCREGQEQGKACTARQVSDAHQILQARVIFYPDGLKYVVSPGSAACRDDRESDGGELILEFPRARRVQSYRSRNFEPTTCRVRVVQACRNQQKEKSRARLACPLGRSTWIALCPELGTRRKPCRRLTIVNPSSIYGYEGMPAKRIRGTPPAVLEREHRTIRSG